MGTLDDLFDNAERLERDGDLYSALECWSELANMKSDPAVLCRFAGVAMELELMDDAERAFRAALELDKSLVRAYVGLGTLMTKKNDYQSAERFLRQALAHEEKPSTYCLLGSAQLDLNRIEEARKSFLKALAMDPRYEEAYYNLGVTYRETNQREAERLFRQSIAIDGQYAEAHRELGWLLLNSGDIDEAEVHLRRARHLDPESMWGRIYLANLLWQRGYLIEAREEYVAAVLLAHGLGYPRFLFGNFLEAQGELDEATKLYSAALELEPDNAETLAKLAGVMCRKGDPAAAREFVARALKIEPTNKTALRILETLEAVRRRDELFPT